MLAALTLINSALSVVYYLRLIHIILFAKPTREMEHVKEAPLLMLIPIVILTMQIFLIGIVWPKVLFDVVETAAKAVLKM